MLAVLANNKADQKELFPRKSFFTANLQTPNVSNQKAFEPLKFLSGVYTCMGEQTERKVKAKPIQLSYSSGFKSYAVHESWVTN